MPPKKINKSFYVCNKQFTLDSILDMYKTNEERRIGVILIDGDKFDIYIITKTGNSHYENKRIYSDDGNAIKRHRKGGQSSIRFARLADEKEEAYVNFVAETTIKYLMVDNNTTCLVEKLLICGPSNKKNYLKDHEFIIQYFSNKLRLVTTAEITQRTIHEILTVTSRQYFYEEDNLMFSNIISDIQQQLLLSNGDKFLFGITEVGNGIVDQIIKTVYVAESISVHFNNSNTEIIVIPDVYLDKIGINCIGVKYY